MNELLKQLFVYKPWTQGYGRWDDWTIDGWTLNLVIFAYVISGVSVMLENSSDDQACLSQEIFVFIKDGLQKRKINSKIT